MLVAEDLMNDLGIETEQRPTAKGYQETGPVDYNRCQGVFMSLVTLAHQFSNIVTAMAHGMIWSLIGIMGLN
jgi:hypothetical protein